MAHIIQLLGQQPATTVVTLLKKKKSQRSKLYLIHEEEDKKPSLLTSKFPREGCSVSVVHNTFTFLNRFQKV